ncbi:MAG: hypothetical protein FJ095_09240, partial [Deltaproteobacteria bacterium]|nr:hypothetical protein [Deltaproteobacteria bacterium]
MTTRKQAVARPLGALDAVEGPTSASASRASSVVSTSEPPPPDESQAFAKGALESTTGGDVDLDDMFDAEPDAAEPRDEEMVRAAAPTRSPDSPLDVRAVQGDTMLARYFRDMSHHPVMDHSEEVAAAVSVESAECAHWVALLAYLPAASSILRALREDVARDTEGQLVVAELEAALKLVTAPPGKTPSLADRKLDRYTDLT